MSDAIFEIKDLSKSFGSTLANRHVNLSLNKGEIRGLIGENGSGKSTLFSQIAGIYPQDSGEMYLGGELYSPHSPMDAYNCHISMVLQELGVIGNLPVDINVFLGRTDQFTKFGVLNTREMRDAAAAIFEEWDIPMPPLSSTPGNMLIENRKMVELARALSVDPNIILLDEVTQSLSLNNREKLYAVINRLKEMDRSVLLITHDVEEMIRITDTITVLRDGEVVKNLVSADTTPDEVKQLMVGREMSGDYYRADMKVDCGENVVLSVKDLCVKDELEDISFDLHEGEILGLCGLSDSGIHSVGRAVYGLSKISSGSVHLNTNDMDIRKPMQSLKNNMGYVPKDRDKEGMMLETSIRENLALPSLGELTGPVGYVSPNKINKLSKEMVDQLSIKCTGIKQTCAALSGGNKQKVNLGRWLAKDLKVLILDCPTRGVDVGVKAYIYQLMQQAKKDKIAMLLISDELTEVIGMADNLIVMKDGKITKRIRRDGDFTEQAVIEVMI